NSPYYTDPHELLLTPSGPEAMQAHLFGYDLRRMDLSSIGGGTAVLVAGHALLRQRANGSPEFLWSSWDHFTLEDWLQRPSDLSQATLADFDHPNSLDIDAEGDYLVSFANLREITKIDGVTGRVHWHFGGRNNQFKILGDSMQGFGVQHDVR